jgi:hypothetical protein
LRRTLDQNRAAARPQQITEAERQAAGGPGWTPRSGPPLRARRPRPPGPARLNATR